MNYTKKQYLQSYIDKYSKEFLCIKKSSLGEHYAFFSVFNSDIKICYSRKNITAYLNRQKHLEKSKNLGKIN